jgi:predicted metal-dependent hydrolase
MKAAATKMAKASSYWQGREELQWAVQYWSARIGVKAPRVHMRGMRRKWASISGVGRLTLNTELVGLPKELGEFVIVHELVHKLVPNHGKVFKSFMYAYLPDWEQRQRRLQNYVQTNPNCQR